ncbi:MAG: hypothetical protein ACRCU0_06415 [Candidatus Rhabdochlamydia sp.]
MWIVAVIPFVLQAVAMAFDEGYFHIKRKLPRWERIGHPIDTLSVLICFSFVLLVPFSFSTLKTYLLLATISCILVTKDEFVHKHHCCAKENWLHALLFTLHPITLGLAGFIWPISQDKSVVNWMQQWLSEPQILRKLLLVQVTMLTLFLIYQVVFWNLVWKEKCIEEE